MNLACSSASSHATRLGWNQVGVVSRRILYHCAYYLRATAIIADEDYYSEPCIRGHRASSCVHYDRYMVRVKRPGRPLSTCPHNTPQCHCAQEEVIMVRIYKGGLLDRVAAWRC